MKSKQWNGCQNLFKEFIFNVRNKLGVSSIGRKRLEAEESSQLREAQSPYIDHLRAKKGKIGSENVFVRIETKGHGCQAYRAPGEAWLIGKRR